MSYIDTMYLRLISGSLRNFKQKKENLFNFSCPVCNDSKTNKHKARGYVYLKSGKLRYTCHNCPARMSVGELIKYVNPFLYKEYVMEKYKEGEYKSSGDIPKTRNMNFNVPNLKFDLIQEEIPHEHMEVVFNLPDDHICKKYIISRKIPEEYYKKLFYTPKYKQFADSLFPGNDKNICDDERLIIPFYDEYEKIVAITGRALGNCSEKVKYITIREKDSENKLLYGLDRIDKNKIINIVEGPLDSLFLDNCIASSDANLMLAANELKCQECLLIFDNECRNKEIVKLMTRALKKNYKIVIWPDTLPYKDINEMIIAGLEARNIKNIIKQNTYSGLQGIMHLNGWKKI